jgi:hypothetical protein
MVLYQSKVYRAYLKQQSVVWDMAADNHGRLLNEVGGTATVYCFSSDKVR